MATGIVAQASIIGVVVMGLAIKFTDSKNIEEEINAELVDYSYQQADSRLTADLQTIY